MFIILFGLGIGFSQGFGYGTTITSAWTHFPTHKGLVSGIILCAFAFGTNIFSIISLANVNPQNKQPIIEQQIGTEVEHFFEFEVAQNVRFNGNK
jgi:hypothetical protein